jgi:hypothetical protein
MTPGDLFEIDRTFGSRLPRALKTFLGPSAALALAVPVIAEGADMRLIGHLYFQRTEKTEVTFVGSCVTISKPIRGFTAPHPAGALG